MKRYKNPGPCVTQVYQDDAGRWWRYCLTCDDGSNKYGKHLRGHKTEADARMSARDHAKATEANRQTWLRILDRYRRVVAATDWETFWNTWWEGNRWARKPAQVPDPNPALMQEIQEQYRGYLREEESR